MTTKSLTLFAATQADVSAGFASEGWTIENLGILDEYKGQREDVRKAFIKAFKILSGEVVRVWFSDEQLGPEE